MLVMVTPGSFQQFLEELSSLHSGLPAPDLVCTERLMLEYGIALAWASADVNKRLKATTP
jgi:hypothetical protein